MIFLQPFPNRGLSFYRPKYVYTNFERGMWPQKTVCPARDKCQTCQQHKSVLHQLCDCQRMFKVVSICLVGEEKARQTLRRKRLTARCSQAQYVCRGRILHFLPLLFSRFLLFWYLLCRTLLLQILDATNLPFFVIYILFELSRTKRGVMSALKIWCVIFSGHQFVASTTDFSHYSNFSH